MVVFARFIFSHLTLGVVAHEDRFGYGTPEAKGT
jgi:hypothetical protein